MSYKAIFEIGPIHQTLIASRKLRDYAGASFLFSYLMGVMAKKIITEEGVTSKDIPKKVNSIIKRPFLAEDPLFNRILDKTKPAVKTGTIPDRIYCTLEKKNTIDNINQEFQNELWNLFKTCISPFESGKINKALVKNQLDNYFRFFYIKSDADLNNFQIEDDGAIIARSDILEFDYSLDGMNIADSKDDKCSLCGDRKKIDIKENVLRNGKPEHLCAVCILKRRFLHKHAAMIETTTFESTTDIASLVVRHLLYSNIDILKRDITSFADSHFVKDAAKKTVDTAIPEVRDELEEKEIKDLADAIDSNNIQGIINKISYQYFFSDQKAATDFRKEILDKFDGKTDPEEILPLVSNLDIGAGIKIKPWLKQAFYCILTLDGDGTADLLRKCEKDDVKDKANGGPGDKSQKFSEAISAYSSGTAKIIEDNHGRLIFSGGEDTIAVLHPLFLIKTVKELSKLFRKEVKEKTGKQALLSAGAVICHHKHPLTLAIQDANDMLFDRAKNIDGKASLAVKLIKGFGEACYYHSKIKDVDQFDLDKFENLIGIGIPRSFVYKLVADKEVLQGTLNTPEEMWGYVKFLFEKSRQTDDVPPALEQLVLKSKNTNDEPDMDQIINRLYFARFLEGESL